MAAHAKSHNDFKHLRTDLHDIKMAAPVKLNLQVKELEQQGRKIHHLGFGLSPFPVPESLLAALKKHAYRNEYAPSAGIPELRTAVGTFFKAMDVGIPESHLSPDNVVVTTGSKMALYLLLELMNTDAVILFKTPTWTTYQNMVELAGRKYMYIQTAYEDNWKLTPQSLKQAIESRNTPDELRVLLFVNPCNPTGAVYSEQEMKALAAVFREYDILVISDEVYSQLTYTDEFVSISKYYPEGTVVTNSISKWASAGGWRVGYAMFPQELSSLKYAFTCAVSNSFTTCAVPQQCAAAEFISDTEACKEFIFQTRRIIQAVSTYCSSQCTDMGIQCHPAGAGFFIYPDFASLRTKLAARGIHTGKQLCDAILDETNIAVLAGAILHMQPENALTVRLGFVNFEGAPALDAACRMDENARIGTEFLQIYCRPTLDAMQALASWCKKL